ncbi:MAG: PIN domain-containing protein [Candidatus Sulfotelmatobacter sp.]
MPPTVLPITPPGVFIDSGGLIALNVPDDTYHLQAIQCWDQTLQFSRLYTSSAVVGETIGNIQRNRLLDQQSLYDLITDLDTEGWMQLLTVDDAAARESLRMVKEKKDRRFSFVDATNIVLMERHEIEVLFSFDTYYDGVFLRRGFNQRPILRIGP